MQSAEVPGGDEALAFLVAGQHAGGWFAHAGVAVFFDELLTLYLRRIRKMNGLVSAFDGSRL
jgi:hypothetical protein